MNTLSPLFRKKILNQLPHTKYDLVIIGGGITGAGIALDAQSRGLKTLVLEMQDFAAGTSSRSTKLVHGGLRYLKQLEFGLVAEVGKERKIVYENGRHVTRPEVMILPVVKNGSLSKLAASIGLWIYDFLAGVAKHEKRKMLNKDEMTSKEPMLDKQILLGGASYYEYRTDDARLVIETLKKAVEMGSEALNYTKASALDFSNSNEAVVEIFDCINQQTYFVKTSLVINASGPWVDTIDNMLSNAPKPKMIHTKGIHIVLDATKFPIQNALYFDAGDGRMIFAIPRSQKVYIGTTDTTYNQDLANPLADREDKEYLLKAINLLFPDFQLNMSDIESTWVGIRPMVKKGKTSSNAQISRKDEIFEHSSGLITIAGGKLTGYRKMAERVVNIVTKRLSNHIKNLKPCHSHHIQMSGGVFQNESVFQSTIQKNIQYLIDKGVENNFALQLAYRYGSNFEQFSTLIEKYLLSSSTINIEQSILMADIEYCVEHEAVLTISDYFIRRSSYIYFNLTWLRKWKNEAKQHLQQLLGLHELQTLHFEAKFEKELLEITE
jgi:glycerol-3-phosphate dehydrogenase